MRASLRRAGLVGVVALLGACATAGDVTRERATLGGRLDAAGPAAERCAPRALAAARVALDVAQRASELGDGVAAARALRRAAVSTDEATDPAVLAPCRMPAVSAPTGPHITPIADGDGDGVPDAQDRCLTAREDRDGWLDEDGCPDPDNDGDGIGDQVDQCPTDPEDIDGFEDIDGCPEEGGER